MPKSSFSRKTIKNRRGPKRGPRIRFGPKDLITPFDKRLPIVDNSRLNMMSIDIYTDAKSPRNRKSVKQRKSVKHRKSVKQRKSAKYKSKNRHRITQRHTTLHRQKKARKRVVDQKRHKTRKIKQRKSTPFS